MVGEEMENWIIASLCLFRWHQHPPLLFLALRRLPEHQLHQHPNAMATASCDTDCCGFPPSLAPKMAAQALRGHILQIQPPIHLNQEEAVGQNQWGVLAITNRGRVHWKRKTPVHITKISIFFSNISQLRLRSKLLLDIKISFSNQI